MPRLFTIQEAEALLPEVERWLRSAIESRRKMSAAEEQFNALLLRIHMAGGVQIDVAQAAEWKGHKDHHLEKLKETLQKFESSGVLLKDLDIGLIDFPTLLDGQEVYLCWKLGEAHIGFWHHTTEGYAGRKQIDGDFLKRHKGHRPQ